MNKKCKKCNKLKSIEDYHNDKYSKDGKVSACKKCRVKTTLEYEKTSDGKISKKRYTSSQKGQSTRSKYNQSEYAVKKKQEYSKTDGAKNIRKIIDRKYREKSPEKVRARVITYNAVRRGDLIKKTCEVCKCSKVQAHHDDYSKPLEVRWLCSKHHREIHNKINTAHTKSDGIV